MKNTRTERISVVNPWGKKATFSLTILPELEDKIFSVYVKKGIFKHSSSYKKQIYTNGKLGKDICEKYVSDESNSNDAKAVVVKVDFKVSDADWLVISHENGAFEMYIKELYCGAIKIKDKKIQQFVQEKYNECVNRKDNKLDFARSCTEIARKLHIPYDIVMVFKGNEKALACFINNINTAIANHKYEDAEFMKLLKSNDNNMLGRAIKSMGVLDLPTYRYEKIANYITQCLENRKII